VPEVIGAFAGWEGCEGSGDGAEDCIASSRGRLSRERFELSEDLLDRIEGWRVLGKEDEGAPPARNPIQVESETRKILQYPMSALRPLKTRERSLLHVETGQADWVLTLGLAMTALVRPKCNIL
jgi:hypothetical protein